MRVVFDLVKVRISAMMTLSGATGYILFARRVDAGIVLPLAGLFLAACGASAINQWQEARLDARMARTRNRPIPSGRMGRGTAFGVGMLLLLSGASALSSLERNGMMALAAAGTAVFWYNVVYTELKHLTPFAVIPGALVGAVPPLVGWLAAGGDPRDPMILLVSAFFFVWQVPHFWLLLVAWERDYEAAGFPTLGRLFAPAQVRRIAFIWLLAVAATGTLLPTLARARLGTAWSAGLVCVSILMGASAFEILHGSNDTAPFHRAFLRLNLYALAVMAGLSMSALTA